MSARDEIMGRIRRSLKVTGEEAPRRAAVSGRLTLHPAGIAPSRGQGDEAQRRAAFRAETLRAGATLAEVASTADIPAEIARFLRDLNAPATLMIGDDPRLADLPWGETAIEIERGPSDGGDLNAATAAFAAVAETGSLMLVSGRDNPTTLNFLPDNHVVVVFAEDLVGDFETAFAALRRRYGFDMPRAVNFITGPSRSGDIEQTLLFGAHGPRRLHVVLAGAAPAEESPPQNDSVI